MVIALCRQFPELREQLPEALYGAQVSWHRNWAESNDQWRQDQALTPLDPLDYLWPIARPEVA